MRKILYLLIFLNSVILWNCKEDPPVEPDTTIAPEVKIVWPVNGTNVLDTTNITIEATDDKNVSKIEIFIDNINNESMTLTIKPYVIKLFAEYYDPSTPHTIIAKAYDEDDNVSSSEEITINTIQFQPTNLFATITSDTSLFLRWRDNSNVETGFEIEQKIANGSWVLLTTADSNVTSLTLNGEFHSSTMYHYRIRSFNSSTFSSYSEEDTATITIPVPTNLKVAGISSSSLKLSWKDNCIYETGYTIERSINGGAFSFMGEVQANQTEFVVSDLDTTLTYQYLVKTKTTYNLSAGSETINSGYIFTGTVNRTLVGHTGYIKAGLFTPDDQYIVTCGFDRNINIFNAATGSLIRTIFEIAPVNYIDISNDGNLIAAALENGVISINNFNDGSNVRTLIGHTESVQCVKFNEDNTKLVSGGKDQRVLLWNVNTGTLTDSLIGHAGLITRVLFTPDQQKIISSDYNRAIKIWDIATSSLIANLSGHTGVVFDIDINDAGTRLISCSNDRTVKIWNLTNNSLFKSLTGHTASVYSVKFSSTGLAITSGGSDRRVRFWRTDNGAFMSTITYIPETINYISFSSDNTSMVTGGTSRISTLWDVTYKWSQI